MQLTADRLLSRRQLPDRQSAGVVQASRFRPVPGYKPKPAARPSLRPEGDLALLMEPR